MGMTAAEKEARAIAFNAKYPWLPNALAWAALVGFLLWNAGYFLF